MINRYVFLYYLVNIMPHRTKKLKRLYSLLKYYYLKNTIVLLHEDGTKTINPLRIPHFLHVNTHLTALGNKVIVAENQIGGKINLRFCDARNNTFEIDANNNICMNVQIRGNDGYASIGKNNHMCGTTLYMLCSGTTRFTIGNNNLFSEKIIFWAGDGHTLINPLTNKISNLGGNITIGDNNWICMNVCFLKRAKIGNGNIVGYGSVISSDLSDNDKCVIAGNPAKIVKHDVLWANTSPWDYDGKLYI